jgi:hypothetical protein
VDEGGEMVGMKGSLGDGGVEWGAMMLWRVV